ncbi:MAG: DMT family transporter [Candidatus Sericytochromatia bacterium]
MLASKFSEKQIAYFQLHFCVFLWGFTAILGKLIQIGELPLVWFRVFITCISLFFIPQFLNKIKKIEKKYIKKLALIGCLVATHWLFFYGSIKYSNASIGVICMSTSAFFTSIINPIVFKTKFNRKELFFAIFVIIGMILIFNSASFYFLGIILGLIGALLASIFTILNKSMVDKVDSLSITFIELFSGFILLSILSPLYIKIFPNVNIYPSQKDFFYLIVLSLLCTTLPFNLSLKALKHVSAFTANFAVNLEPIYGILMAIAIFKENKELTLSFYLGAFIILASVFLQGFLVEKVK